ncbi:MAG TPA: Holliday junction branch migration DNA helicase RuvB [Planctomycetes bacterium]|nr:Holliday junction branch migration DNA helicase RuvB [Planctomycetota bacterium]
MNGEETLQSRLHDDESRFESGLRPKTFDDFVGQERVRENLQVYIRAALQRGEPMDHILLTGLPGLGKTTLADIVARAMNAEFHSTTGPALERPGDLAGMLTSLSRGDVLFIDEIHRLSPTVEEFLYSAMEDFCIDIVLDQGPRGRTVRLNLEPFTLIGATTRDGLLSAPFRDRFGVLERLEPYPEEELERILRRSARLLNVALTDDGAKELARHARGTPRIVNRFLRRVRDLAQVETTGGIDRAVAERGLRMLGIDDDGLLRVDRLILETLALAEGRPVGLKTMAVTVGEDPRTLEDVFEPHLIREGLLLKTARGRLLTHRGYALLGQAPPRVADDGQGHLFHEEP